MTPPLLFVSLEVFIDIGKGDRLSGSPEFDGRVGVCRKRSAFQFYGVRVCFFLVFRRPRVQIRFRTVNKPQIASFFMSRLIRLNPFLCAFRFLRLRQSSLLELFCGRGA